MVGLRKLGFALLVGVALATVLASAGARAATKAVDLDGNAANGAESQCDLNILQTFPVMIENRVTNKSAGDAFSFSWPSAGPGGFTSSVPAGTTAGVGSKWVWTTNQSVFSFTGNSCANDVCFTQTAGPDPITSFCSFACLADPTSITIAKGAAADAVVLNWTGGQGPFTIYRASNRSGVAVPTNVVGTTDGLTFTDTPPRTDAVNFYIVRGVTCTTRKACTTNNDCSAPGDGTCVSRGPFGVPGRSLLATSVTVSAASLTSSLITFFSPPKEVFRATSTAGAGGISHTNTNSGTTPVTVTIPAYPAGCCPADPEVPHQLRCGETCVDYLNDPDNCGACGNVCGDGECCSNGSCASLCAPGDLWCGQECADIQDDDDNCGSCGGVCGDGTCCNGALCESLCDDGQVWCDNQCVDFENDSANCGACGTACGEGSCCDDGACVSVCPIGRVWCNDECVDFDNDSANCGACGTLCGEGTCCNEGACETFCPEGQVLCGTQCVDPDNDNDNCGACGNACGDGTCCSEGSCASVCPAGQVWCNNQCVDLRNDSDNCGTCGNACGEGTCCNASACVSVCPAGRTLCGDRCVDLDSDSRNCGSCGNVCGDDDLDGHDSDHHDTNRCTDGECEYDSLYSSLSDPPSTPPVCPNPTPTHPEPGHCPNSTPTEPTPGSCQNENPSDPIPGSCPNTTPTSPVPGYCRNPHPSPGPVAGVCPEPSGPPPGIDAAICTIPESTTTIPPGGSTTTCIGGGVLFKEVPTHITVCGDGIPGVDGECNNAATKISTGTYSRLVPDPTITVGDAYVTPYAIHVVADTSNDGLIEPGETASLVIEALNAGPLNITNANATLTAPALDLTDDGVSNPVGITVSAASVSYGTIFGTPAAADCTAPPLQPASNVTVFQITVPANHPGDTSHPMILAVTGTVNGGPFSMNVPIVIGIADRCDFAARNRDYDGLDGLSSPMKPLVPAGETVPMAGPFNAGNTRPLKLRVLCGSENLTAGDVDAPEIIGLSEATRGELDIRALNLNSDNTNNPNDPFFRFNNSLSGGQWSYSMRTALIGTGTFTLKIRIAGRKEYVTGFVLR